MNINSANLDTLFIAINNAFAKGLASEWKDWERFAMSVNSSTAIEKYPSLLMTGAMREWIGERVISEIEGNAVEVRNRDFEKTLGVSRNALEDDTYGFFAPLFEAIGVEAANLWGRLATEALTNPGNWADGSAFFGSRKIGKATINNLVSGNLTTSNYETARSRMMAFKEADNSTALGLIPDVIIVGPALEGTAKRIFKTDLVVENNNTVSNIHKDEVEILVDPYLSGNDWYLACTSRGLKPLVVQKRKVGTLIRWDKDSDECVKNHNRFEYGIDSRGAAAPVCPHLIIKGAAS